MIGTKQLNDYLPLTEATFYILLSLTEPRHGYAVMQDVESMSNGTVKLGPGTLYGAFSKLEENHLIKMIDEIDRRKIYTITDSGRQVLSAQADRYEVMLENVENRKARF
ncbi:MAG: PadR family transcriptional regulator [Anaerolineales bacterium]|jgi:DNA-binding PadR family transcriptional regulator